MSELSRVPVSGCVMPDASQARNSIATISSAASYDNRRQTRPAKENQWLEKYGRKHHNYTAAKAPYPLSYDKDILDRDAIDLSMCKIVMASPCAACTTERIPQRVLDLGCGTGAWIISTARQYWRNTIFVGFDLVNIQIPPAYLEPELAHRISWQHGNFLAQRLPFDDSYFDFVRISNVARGVPENKWTTVFEEVNRVLAPDGLVEVSEEDILFPIIPRWFTDPLRAKPRTRASSKASTTPIDGPEVENPPSSPPNSPVSEPMKMNTSLREEEVHGHVFLELLFVSLHESRFINMKPTNILPVYFTPFFSRCMHGPKMHFGMPFLSPLKPLPPRQSTEILELAPRVNSTIFARPQSAFSSSSTQLPAVVYPPSSAANPEIRRSSSFGADSDISSRYPQDGSLTPTLTTPDTSIKDGDDIWYSWTDHGPNNAGGVWTTPLTDGSKDPNVLPGSPFRELDKLSSRTRAVLLWHAFLGVRGCQEAMWEELLLLQGSRAGRERLREVGWVPSKPTDQQPSENMSEQEQKDAGRRWEALDRHRFEEMFDIYEQDVCARASFWYSATELGLPLPKREPLPKADLAEEERQRRAILDSRALLAKDDSDIPAKTVRVFVGYKIPEGEETSAQNALDGLDNSVGLRST